MVSEFRIFLVLAVFCLSCKQKLSREAFIQWYQGVPVLEKETENLRFRIRYFPVELLMMDKKISEQELDMQKEKFWLTIDIDSKRYFASGQNAKTNTDGTNALKLNVTLKDHEPGVKINEYSSGKGIEGRWILGWNEAYLKEDNLVIRIEGQSIEIPLKEVLPDERPTLKI